MRMGIAFSGVPFAINTVAELVKRAENKGFSTAWFAEDYFLRDAITALSFTAALTKRIKLGTGIINPYTRHPILIAETIATLSEATGGRVFLSLGTGVGPLIEQMGIKFRKPVTTIREAVEIIRSALAGSPVTFEGEVFNIRDVRLGYNPYLSQLGEFKPKRGNIPIYIAAIGPKMLQLAGKIGDGVLLTAGCSPNYVKNMVVGNVAKGAEESGKNPKKIDVAALILSSINPTATEKIMLKSFVAFELSYASEEYLKASEVDLERVAEIRNALFNEGIVAAAKKVSDETLSRFSAFGDKRAIRERIIEYRKAGVTTPVILPVTRNPIRVKQLIDTIHGEIIKR